MIFVSPHALTRFQERVEPCSAADAHARIMGAARAIEAAATIGCEVVRLACGARLILDGSTVVTVYGPGQFPRQCRSSHRNEGVRV